MELWLSTTAGISASRVTAVAKALDSQGFDDPQALAELDSADKLALFAALENVDNNLGIVNVGERAKIKKAIAVSGGERRNARDRSLSPAANPSATPNRQMSGFWKIVIIGLLAGVGIEYQIRSLANTGIFAYHTGIPIQINALQALRVVIFIILLLCSCKA
jgi:hypothetical protein